MINIRKNRSIVRSNGPILLVGGGIICPDDLNLALIRVNSVVAVDGGAAAVLAAGKMPDAVIGDFDSLRPSDREQIPADRLFPIREQDSTDFDKAVRSVEAPLMLGIGFLGGRLDHQLAVLNTLARRPDQVCILIGEHEVVFHVPPVLSLPLTAGDVVSLFPFQRVTGRSTGLEWPIDDLVLDPNGRVGTSNRAISGVTFWTDGPGLIAMVPRTALDDVMQAFQSEQTGRSPAPAG